MAHLDLRFLSISLVKVCRHKGASFPDKLAYIARTDATNPRTGAKSDYRAEGPVETVGVAGWDGSRDELIDCAVFSEVRKKAVEGRHLILALPHEFNRDERRGGVEKMASHLVTNYGVAVAFAIHPPAAEGDQRNWHAHLLFTSRRVVGGRSLGKKTRELDSLKTGGGHVGKLRAWWCAALNTTLLETGRTANIEHRSFERLGIEGVPTKHRGERRVAIQRAHARSQASAPKELDKTVMLDSQMETISTAPEIIPDKPRPAFADMFRCRPGQPWPKLGSPIGVKIETPKQIPATLVPVEPSDLTEPAQPSRKLKALRTPETSMPGIER